MRVKSVLARVIIALGACVAVAIVVAGCGSSGSSSSGGGSTSGGEAASTFPAAVKANEKWEKRPTSIGLTTPVEKPIPKGKVIDYIQCGVPACATEGDQFEEAMKLLGWKLNRVNAGSTPEEIKNAYQKAIGDKPDAVVGSGNPLVLYESEAKELEGMGIPVVQSFIQDEPEEGNGLTAVVAGNETSETQGKMMADFILAHSEDESMEVGVVNVNGFETVTRTAEVVKQTVEEECSGCAVKELDVPVTSIGSDLPQRVSSFLTSNPGIEWATIGYDDMVSGLPTALKGAGVESVKLTTINISPSIAPYMAKGEYLQATIGTSFPEVYWRVIDTLVRIFNEEPLKEDLNSSTLPYWTITAKTLPSESEEFAVVENYQEQFEKLWGLK
jgi:ribose transport system substrate-binding protein